MVIVPATSYRIPGILVVAIALAAIVSVNMGRGRRLSRVLRRCVNAVSPVVLLAACLLIVVPTRAALEGLLREARSRWLQMLEPNILNHHVLVAERNKDIRVPVESVGIALAERNRTDLHVELDSRGWLSIYGAQLSREQLAAILSRRIEAIGGSRVFIWADADAPPDSCTTLIRILQDAGCAPLYFVVASPPTRENKTDYKALPCAAYLKTSDQRNANKTSGGDVQ